jgi:uncharacterized protein with PhoU and TrkA domain
VGQTLASVFKSNSEIPVFALSRDNSLLWNPSNELQLRYEDVLICYGELTELRTSLRQAMLDVPLKEFSESSAEETNA